MASTSERIQSSGFPTSRYIHLNVGGKLYMTSQDTLTRHPESMLGHMFTQERIPLAKDEQGRLLIDRDGELFRYILNFLRGGKLCLPDDFSEHAQLLEEARFYQIDDLVKRLGVKLNVGGVRYTTTKVVLTKHRGSLLKALFSEEPILLNKDQEGYYIIKDGDGPLFQYILNYLEDEDLHLPEYFDKFAELQREAERYKLEAITQELKVCLNIGGREYTTTRATLIKIKGSLLQEIFTQTPIPLERDQLGRFMIQRDGQIFQYLLNYMETGKLNLPKGHILYKKFEAEVDYYKLPQITPGIRVGFRTNQGRSNLNSLHMYSYTISWKNLTKYKGSLLEESFSNAMIHQPITHLRGDYHLFTIIARFLDTGHIPNIPPQEYQRLLQEARQYRLDELVRLLTNG